MARKAKGSGSGADDAVIIKKYANRRLYNTSSSSYITLEDLATMVRENIEFVVLDAKSGDDITHSILTQIIMDEESSGGQQMLPVSFLRQLIGMYGNSMQSMMPSYLEASMDNFRQNQTKIREAFESGMNTGPLAAIHETNMAMMRAAANAFIPGSGGKPSGTPQAKRAEAGSVQTDATQSDTSAKEIAALRDQMAAMQKKLDDLGK